MINVNQTLSDFLIKNFEANLVKSISDKQIDGVTIKHLCFDSREVKEGDAFVVLPSVAGNEQEYVDKATAQGCKLIITQQAFENVTVPAVLVADVMDWAGQFLKRYHQKKTQALNVMGITGTNGKSSISFYLAQLLNELERVNNPEKNNSGINKQACAVMGTLGYGPWDQLKATGMTTLPLEKLHAALSELSENFAHVAIEVSSHGLEQKRLSGVEFSLAVFSNLSRDHLDYHGTMAAYGAEKAKLFQWPTLQNVVINIDDAYGAQLAGNLQHVSCISYGKDSNATLRFTLDDIDNAGLVISFYYQGQQAQTNVPLYGEFNAYNSAAALACALTMGFEFEQAVAALHVLIPVEGRMMQVQLKGDVPLVLVDYAHTPDALEQVLKSVQSHCQGEIHLVVGCGGDRDQGKRPLMAKIAVQFADKVVFTSDNPRSESPEKILQDMTQELSAEFVQEVDRKTAVELAVLQADANDLVIIAGKGHEDYQEISGQRLYFSDKAVALEALQHKLQLEKTL